MFSIKGDYVEFLKVHLELFSYENECNLSDFFVSEPKTRLIIVRFDPLNGLFLFDMEQMLLIRLKLDIQSRTRPIKCSLSEGKL